MIGSNEKESHSLNVLKLSYGPTVAPGFPGLRLKHKHMDLSNNKQDAPPNNAAKDACRCTLGADKRRKRSQRCWWMYPWGRNWQETFPRVQPDVPLEPESTGNGATGADGCTLGADKHRKRSHRCWWMYPWGRNWQETFPRVQPDVPLEPESAGNGAKGAGGCTPGGEIGRKRSQGCSQMYPWSRKAPETEPKVPMDVPLEPISTGNDATGAGKCTEC